MTQGRCGSLLHIRMTLSFTTPRRFIRRTGEKSMAAITTKDGTQIFYKDWGPKDAQPIVFHHGWPLSSDDWDNQMLFFLANGYRVVAHGRGSLFPSSCRILNDRNRPGVCCELTARRQSYKNSFGPRSRIFFQRKSTIWRFHAHIYLCWSRAHDTPKIACGGMVES